MESLVKKSQDDIAPFSGLAKNLERDMHDGTPVITINNPEYADLKRVRVTSLSWSMFFRSNDFKLLLIGFVAGAAVTVVAFWPVIF